WGSNLSTTEVGGSTRAGSGREGHRFGESVTPRFAEIGCGESRPNPAGNEPAPIKRSTGLTTPRPPRLKPPDPLAQAPWRSKASEETRPIQGCRVAVAPVEQPPRPCMVLHPHRPPTPYSRAQLSHRTFRWDASDNGNFMNASTECGYFES